MRFKYKIMFTCFFFILVASSSFADETIEIETEQSRVDIVNESLEATGRITIKYEDITISADNLKKLEGRNIVFAYGNVLYIQGDQNITANQLIFDLDTRKARIIDAKTFNQELQMYMSGEDTFVDEEQRMTILNSSFTGSSFEEPLYKIEAKKVLIDPGKKLEIKDFSLLYKDKKLFTLPYYVTSLRPASRRATLFPYIGSTSDKGLYGVWGLEYDRGDLFQGFIDFEYSQKKNLALKVSNDYKIGNTVFGNIFVNRYVVPVGNDEKEWDFEWTNSVIYKPKKPINQLKFYELGPGIWNMSYKNITTNLMNAVDGSKLKDDYSLFVDKYKSIGTYDVKIDQMLGQNGEFNLDYKWTHSKNALKELSEINNDIVEKDDIDPRRTDIDLYQRLNYLHKGDAIDIILKREKFIDINPGYIGDPHSYMNLKEYSVNLKGPKIKAGYYEDSFDEYTRMYNLKQRDKGDHFTLDPANKLLQTTAYEIKKISSVSFGNYYPFKETDFFGYKQKDLARTLINDFYFGFDTQNVSVKKKTYEYDFTTDNPNYLNMYGNSLTTDDSRIYKIHDNAEKIRRTRQIIDEEYFSQVFKTGNSYTELPINNSYITYGYSYERRDYQDVYIPVFDSDNRKIEDLTSKTNYQIKKDALGNNIKTVPNMNIHGFNFSLFTTLYDNTNLLNNKYDLRITNNMPVFIQRTNAENVMEGKNDIVELPTNIYAFGDDFNVELGNVRFINNFYIKKGKHFREDYLKESFVKNFSQISIDNNRFLSLDVNKLDKYEFQDYKSDKKDNFEIKYGYTNEKNNNFLYKIIQNNEMIFPNNDQNGWQNKDYKERMTNKNFSVQINEWGVEYGLTKERIRDVYSGAMDTKLESRLHTIGFVYDTTRKKEKNFESDHYFRFSYGFGREGYRNLNNTPFIYTDDTYVDRKENSVVSFLYRYENNAPSRYKQANNYTKKEDLINNTPSEAPFVNSSYDIKSEEEMYQNYVEEERLKQNKFNFTNFDSRFTERRVDRRYFQIGVDLKLDSDHLKKNGTGELLTSINNVIFKVEVGNFDKWKFAYRYVSERPDVDLRNILGRQSAYNFRQHELETKYMFSKDPDKPWWVGYRVLFTQDGAPKAGDPEIYESSSAATRVNKINFQMLTLSHRFENLEWEIGVGSKWDKPDNKELKQYPVFSLSFGFSSFPEKNIKYNLNGGYSEFGAGF